MGKVLIVVQGINGEHDYLYKQVLENRWLVRQYDEIINAETELVFDGKKQKKSGFVRDHLGDVWQFYKKDDKRIKACRTVRQAITKAKSLGHKVDVIAHSLGTVITLCSGSNKPGDTLLVNKFFMMGSPLGFAFRPFRRGIPFFFQGTIPHTEQYSYNFKANEIYYLYSSNDKVSKVFDDRILLILGARCSDSAKIYQTNTSHDAEDYLKYLKEIS